MIDSTAQEDRYHPYIRFVASLCPKFYNRITWAVVGAGLALATSPWWTELVTHLPKDFTNREIAITEHSWIGVALVVLGLLYHLGMTWALKQAQKYEEEKMSDLHPQLKFEGGRWRLDFLKVRKACPDLANRTRLVRNRAKDLNKKFIQDARKSRRYFHGATVFAVCIFIVVAMISVKYTDSSDFSVAAFTALWAIGAIGFALVNSIGLHRQYQAMLAAGWSIASLVTKIDNHILQLSLNQCEDKRLSSDQKDELVNLLSSWNTELARILDVYGSRAAQSLRVIEITNLKNVGIRKDVDDN